MALNEDLLMVIDVLCEELGIDVEELLEVTASTDAQRNQNPQIKWKEGHQLARLRGVADRVNRGTAKLNNPKTAHRRLAALMGAMGSNAIPSEDGRVFADPTNTGAHYLPVGGDTNLSINNLSGDAREEAAEIANRLSIS